MTLTLLWQDRQQSFSSPQQIKLLIADAAEIALMMMRLLPEYLSFYKAVSTLVSVAIKRC